MRLRNKIALGCAMSPALATGRSGAETSAGLAEPRIFAEGVISTADDESNAAFTPDGNTLYFTKSVVASYLYVICVSRFEKGRYGDVIKLLAKRRVVTLSPQLTQRVSEKCQSSPERA